MSTIDWMVKTQVRWAFLIYIWVVFFCANTNQRKYWIRWGLLPQHGGLARDTHRAECALGAAPIRKGVNADITPYAKLRGWGGQYSACNPLLFSLARLEQSNDRVGIRYTTHWSQLIEPSQFLRLPQFRCSRFYSPEFQEHFSGCARKDRSKC